MQRMRICLIIGKQFDIAGRERERERVGRIFKTIRFIEKKHPLESLVFPLSTWFPSGLPFVLLFILTWISLAASEPNYKRVELFVFAYMNGKPHWMSTYIMDCMLAVKCVCDSIRESQMRPNKVYTYMLVLTAREKCWS